VCECEFWTACELVMRFLASLSVPESISETQRDREGETGCSGAEDFRQTLWIAVTLIPAGRLV